VEGGAALEKLLLSVDEFSNVVGIGPTFAKKLIREGRVRTVKLGDRRMVPAQAAREFVAGLMVEAGQAGEEVALAIGG
jgi:excisionase family DNA binding protein